MLSDKLQALRKSKGFTQEKLAEQLQVSRQAVAKWESGMAYPDILNLVQISELFHVTIDYLVKDQECGVGIECLNKDCPEEDIVRLIEFRLEANTQTYAGYMTPVKETRPMSYDYEYQQGDFYYYDSWIGGEVFSGEEVIWKNGKAVYAMNYCGRTLDERFSGDFLKEALRAATKECPYRGPQEYESGQYRYKTQVNGDIYWFQGYEEIYCQEMKVYEFFYPGGIMKSN